MIANQYLLLGLTFSANYFILYGSFDFFLMDE